MTLRDEILDLSRQNNIGELSPFFSEVLDKAIADGFYPDHEKLTFINDEITRVTREYREQTGVSTVVIGMSGGVDSALTAAIFKNAGYRVIGVTMPIAQVQAETDRGVEACEALGIEHQHIDLTDLYDATLNSLSGVGGLTGLDQRLGVILGDDLDAKAVRIRRGNVRARLRMITLYNLANLHEGFVLSTDNLTEKFLGFWSIAGDIGDFAPIQSLTKSWEVPYLARLNGVPEETVRATPTDGLGIDAGDEAQLGASYLEMDLAFYAKVNRIEPNEIRAEKVTGIVAGRIAATWFKRHGTVEIKHPLMDRYEMINRLDEPYVPVCVR